MKIFDMFPTAITKINLLESNNYGAIDLDYLQDIMNTVMLPTTPVSETLEIAEGNVKTCYREDWGQASYVLEEFEGLKSSIFAAVQRHVRTCGSQPVILNDSWYTLQHKGSKVLKHRHEGSVVSGTFYVNVPEGSHGLAFSNPTIPYRMKEKTTTFTKYSEYAKLIEVQTGDLLIYPSWLEHFVPKIECDNRLTISFNTYFARLN